MMGKPTRPHGSLGDPGEFRWPRLLAGYCVLWTLVGLFEFTDNLPPSSMRSQTQRDILVIYLLVAYLWAGLAPLAILVARRFPIERSRTARHVLVHLACSVLFAVAVILAFSGIVLAFGLGQSRMRMTVLGVVIPAFITGIHQHVFTYWAVIGVYHALRYQNAYLTRDRKATALAVRASQLKTELRRAQLHALKAQFEPHFLFNTLNAIMSLVRLESDDEAVEMLRLLRDLLARVFRQAESQEVALDLELEHLQLYLAIEQVRFRDRLHVEISVDPSLRNAAVAHMCLQPIVENAIRHGVARSSAACTITVTAARDGDALRLQVQDDGPGFPAFEHFGVPRRTGIGLSNTRARLQTLYGGEAALDVVHPPQGGTVATIVLPYRALAVACAT